MLNWTSRFNIFCFLDNADYSIQPHQHDCLVGAGATEWITPGSLTGLDIFLKKGRWAFGHLSYDLKNSIHGFKAAKQDPIDFPLFHFFVPQILLLLNGQRLSIDAEEPNEVFKEIINTDPRLFTRPPSVSLQQKLTKAEYLEKIKCLQQHILRGDCYEVNFCQEFYAEKVALHPLQLFEQLIELSPNPFSAFYRRGDQYLLCASPERFLYKKGARLVSQPIKGTIRRNLDNAAEDQRLKQELRRSTKDQSENVMIVDLVRNDLTQVCRKGTVKVDELFGIYSYPQVHQMISTISGEIKENILFSEVIRATYPMGSMTGAPKYRVMELIDEFEVSARGIFSGSVGYINPEGDFDLNVVIRSIMYNAGTNYLSYQVGSGITFYSDPEKEWEECLLKGEAIKKVLTGGSALLK
jgi:para-aminobenzoate synthetase component I